MKKQIITPLATLFLALPSGAYAANESPTGTITANAALVRAGTFPKISWNISYPDKGDGITVNPDGTVDVEKDTKLKVRVIAADVQTKVTSTNRWGIVTILDLFYNNVQGQMKINNSWSWTNLFYGTEEDVNGNQVVYSRDMVAGDKLRFRGKSFHEGTLGYFYSDATASNKNAIILRDGDSVPSYVTWTTQSTLGTHIAPYLDSNGKVDIGKKDVLIAFELTHQMPSTEGDFQDLILLLTFN